MSQFGGSALSAILYDWHNSLLLRAQNHDVGFWIRVLPPLQRVVVMGAGTGRVAVPLAKAGHNVVAVDHDRHRLARIPLTTCLTTMDSDFSSVPPPPIADQVIFPYSALQLVSPADLYAVLNAAIGQLAPGGHIWIDVSNRFASRPSHGWHTVLDAPCAELGITVIERQRGTRHRDHYRIDTLFLSGSETLVEITDRWYFLADVEVQTALIRSGLSVVSCQIGYGTRDTVHRRIYKIKKG